MLDGGLEELTTVCNQVHDVYTLQHAVACACVIFCLFVHAQAYAHVHDMCVLCAFCLSIRYVGMCCVGDKPIYSYMVADVSQTPTYEGYVSW